MLFLARNTEKEEGLNDFLIICFSCMQVEISKEDFLNRWCPI
jgi:hypothetical protein